MASTIAERAKKLEDQKGLGPCYQVYANLELLQEHKDDYSPEKIVEMLHGIKEELEQVN